MAIFIPSLDKISRLKVPPTAGENALLRFLSNVLDNSFEVFFNPYLNGDRPDVLIMRKDYGVMVIEVKDWNLANFKLNERKKWIYMPNNSVVKSPIDQVLKYKQNLFNLHVDQLLEYKIRDYRHMNIVSCAVYFHCASQDSVENLLIHPFEKDKKYQDFLKWNIDLLGMDGLEPDRFMEILKKRHLISNKKSFLFSDKLYSNFSRLLAPTEHLRAEGEGYRYSSQQKEIIYFGSQVQRVKGVFGSGKTTVLAARAVQAYKNALAWNSMPKILILTYNITLKNFIHDKLMRVDETFPIESFIIINYHSFINAELNNLGVEFFVPDDCPEERVGDYLETSYYSNFKLFEQHADRIVKYDAVFIDEIQDYKRPWMDIIKSFFREPSGDYVLFGDVKQNIYGNPTKKKDVITNVIGRPSELKYCYRSGLKVQDLALSFQKEIFGTKYDIDSFEENGNIGEPSLVFDKEGFVNYAFINSTDMVSTLYQIIRNSILKDNSKISPNDITILGYTIATLRLFECYYRYASREKTATMFETIEVMYMTQLNYLGKKQLETGQDDWFKNLSGHLAKKLFPNYGIKYDNDYIKLRQRMAKLFTIYDLYVKYEKMFFSRLQEECERCGISAESFCAFYKHYEGQLQDFVNKVYNEDYKVIRENKKIHFWMNSGTIKVSTINSFKGWESNVVFLIVEPKYSISNKFNESFDELLYTGLTRCKKNLTIVNFGNTEYDLKLRQITNILKS